LSLSERPSWKILGLPFLLSIRTFRTPANRILKEHLREAFMSYSKWPKILPELTLEQRRICDDFVKYWHEVLPKRFRFIEKFNHRYIVRKAPGNFRRTLEIGAGMGEHLEYEKLNPEQESEYVALELRENMAAEIRKKFPRIETRVGDCQEQLDFPDGHFDRIVAIHVPEHLPNLPAAASEMRRLCSPNGGVFTAVIPCEGGWIYSLARRLSAQRIFENRYQEPYDWFIQREHLNQPNEIFEELERHFVVFDQRFFPFSIPTTALNLCIGLAMRPKHL
jgi:SAM-dependent methyltransferase